MSKPGFIKVYRAIQDNWVWDEKPFSKGQAWLDLLMEANFADVKRPKGNQIVIFERGKVYKSQLELSKRWGWSRKKVNGFLTVLESDGMISVCGTTQGTTITIENYEIYQTDGTTTDTAQVATQEQRGNNARTQDKKEKNDKKEKKEVIYSDFVEGFHLVCPSFGRVLKLTEPRKRTIKNAIDEHGLETIKVVLEKAEQSDFLTGRSSDFKASFDWILKPANFIKILEGNYDNRSAPSKNQKERLDQMGDTMQILERMKQNESR